MLAVAHILILESGDGVAGGKRISRNAIIGQGDGSGSGAIIDLVYTSGDHCQVARVNISHGSGAVGIQQIVPCNRTAQAEPGGGHGFAGADVLVAEQGGASIQADIIGANDPDEAAASDHGGPCAVIELIARRYTRGQRCRLNCEFPIHDNEAIVGRAEASIRDMNRVRTACDSAHCRGIRV